MTRIRVLLICATTFALAIVICLFVVTRESTTTLQPGQTLPLRAGLSPNTHITANLEGISVTQALTIYGELIGRTPADSRWKSSLDDFSGGRLGRWHVISLPAVRVAAIAVHADGRWTAQELKENLETLFRTNRIAVVPAGKRHFLVMKTQQR